MEAQDDPRLQKGIDEFNQGLFFECHETLEEIWQEDHGEDRLFYQGIIQIAAAFHHYSRGNARGAHSLLQAALGRLARFPDVHHGIALGALRAAAQEWAAALAAGRNPRPEDPVPQIEFAGNDCSTAGHI